MNSSFVVEYEVFSKRTNIPELKRYDVPLDHKYVFDNLDLAIQYWKQYLSAPEDLFARSPIVVESSIWLQDNDSRRM